MNQLDPIGRTRSGSFPARPNAGFITGLIFFCLLHANPAHALSLWSNSVIPSVESAEDSSAYELGVKFQSSAAGYITGVRFYKGTNNTGTHVGNLWTLGGSNLASVTFTNETATGWQEQLFVTPVPIAPDTTYVASYHVPNGGYAIDSGYFAVGGYTNPPLRALADGVAGGNGVFILSGTSAFPTDTFNSANYWVDVVYEATLGPDTNPPVVISVSPTNGATNVSAATAVTATFNEAMDPATINTDTFVLTSGSVGVVTVDATSFGSATEGTIFPTISELSVSHTTGTGANRLMLAGISFEDDNTANFSITDVQWIVGSTTQALTRVVQRASAIEAACEIWRLTNPTSGAGTVRVIASSGTADGDDLFVGVTTFTGVDQVTPLGTIVSNSGVGTTASVVVSSAPGEVVFDTLGLDDARSASVGANQTQLWNGIAGTANSDGIRGAGSIEPGAASVTMSWTTGSDDWAICAVSIKPAGGGSTVPASVNYNAGTLTATLQPSSPLSFGQTYTATVKGGSSGAKDLATNALAEDHSWSFTTQPPDTTAPTIVSVAPTNGASAVSAGTSVTVVFSEAMDANTISTNTITLLDAGSNAVPATVNYAAGTFTATLQPASALTLGETYTARVKGGGAGVKDLAANPLATDAVWSFTVAAQQPFTIWSDSVTPTHVTFDPGDTNAYEFGVKFQSDINGSVTGVRFYKGPANTGTHLGNLWTADGTLLATATFTGEGASGWQQVSFAAPVEITANTTYIASYFAPMGGYSVDLATDPGSLSAGVTNPPLRALPNAVTPNGLFIQSATSAFPTEGANGINWWVDVMFLPGPDTTAPMVVAVTPTNGATNVNIATAVTVTFNEEMSVATLNTTTFQLRNASSNLIPASVSYDDLSFTATLQPSNTLSLGETYTATVKGGPSGAKDASTNALVNDFVWSFTTQPPDLTPPTVVSVVPVSNATNVGVGSVMTIEFSEAMDAGTINTNTILLVDATSNTVPAAVTYDAGNFTATLHPANALSLEQTYTGRVKGGSPGVKDTAANPLAADFVWNFTTSSTMASNIWGNSFIPANTSFPDPDSYELGVKFRSELAGLIKGIRFYKGTNNTGIHIGNLWTSSGVNLASVTFSNETDEGWQEQRFVEPVSIDANTTYVASYHTPNGGYAVDPGYFAGQGATNYPLHALEDGVDGGNGVFAASTNSTFPSAGGGANYWIDVVYEQINVPPTASNIVVEIPEDTSTNLMLQGADAESAVTFSIIAGPGNGALSGFNTNTGAITYTPDTNYFGPDEFTFRVSDGSLFATGLVSITVTPVNDPPVAADFAVTLPEDTSTNLTLIGSDVESAVTFEILSEPDHGLLSAFNADTGAVTYTPFTNYFGPDAFTYRVSDGSLFATGTVSLTVTAVDDPPQADDLFIAVPRNTSTNLVLTATDVDTPNGVVSEVLPATGTATPNNWALSAGASKVAAVSSDDGDSSYITSGGSANTQQQFTLADPTHIQPGDAINSVTLRSTCRRNSTPSGNFLMTAVLGGSSSAGATQTTANNYADYADAFTARPGGGDWTLADVQNLQIRIQNTQSREIACTRFDAVVNFVGNINRTYAILSGPAHGAVSSLNPNNGTLVYTPATNYAGADSFTFTVNAGGVLSTGLVSISVVGTNGGPVVANPIGTQFGGYGTNFTFTFPTNTFSDPDSPALSYSASGMPPGVSLTSATRTFAGIPTASGDYAVNLVATDDSVPPLSATNTFTITIAKASLTVTAHDTNKPYGVPLSFAGNEFAAAGLKLSDAVTSADLTSAGAAAGAAAGGYPIVVTNAVGTGLTNYVISYVNGTLTVNPSEPYAITSITVSNDVATIAWQSISNRIYRLQYKDEVTAAIWTEVPVDIIGAGASTSTTNATGGATNRFYRVK